LTPKVYALGERLISIGVGDFNRDGDLDLIGLDAYSDVYLILGNGDGSFERPAQFNLNISYTDALAVGDFNGDGSLDFVVAGSYDYGYGTVDVVLGNGDGTFQPGVTYPSGGQASTSV